MNSARKAITFLTGLGLGIGFAILFAPQSGAETREWIERTASDGLRHARKRGRRTMRSLQDVAWASEKRISRVMKTGKNALEAFSAILN